MNEFLSVGRREDQPGEPALPPRCSPEAPWLGEALRLENELWAHARRTRTGEVRWLVPASSQGDVRQAVPLGPHLYDGVAGVAIFLAALERVAGRSGRREYVLAALHPMRRQLRGLAANLDTARNLSCPLGGMVGLGAFVYSFLLISKWLDEPDLGAEAAELATLVTPERIAADGSLDVVYGCAGALLALLALDRVAPQARKGLTPLERALACGEHLLRRRVAVAGQPRAWPVRERPPSCGFAHGAAGISYALARLFERTGERSFRDAAEEGTAFERLSYEPERRNWRLAGPAGTPVFLTWWCRGAPGIALGRAGMRRLLDGPQMRAELRSALATTATCPDAVRDFLCCGNLGNADILLYAHQALGGERLRAAAEAIAWRALSRSRANGGRYCWSVADSFAPSFFKGAAGVGYVLLRLARPSLLPCVLLLEWTGQP
jgi:lantibiotic modifying enzyme